MQPRPPLEDVIRGLKTTSAKIRALAEAGYDRTEISQQLGIKYQHVRKVLLDAGIMDGLRRKVQAEREPVLVDAAPAIREAPSSDILLRAGFQPVGEWTEDPASAIKLDATAPEKPGIYAFVVDNLIVYIGLTNNNLRTRFEQYRRGHEGQRTNARVKKLIVQTLSKGQRVKILVATPEPLEWRGLPVIVAAGLEAGLIQMLRPAWNIAGVV